MAEPTIEEMVADMVEGTWPADCNTYRLNTVLKLKPWWPALPVVWARRDVGPDPGWLGTAYAAAWPDALALAHKLHAKYLESRGGAGHG